MPKNPGVVKGRLPLKLIPALTACTSERMKTFRFSYLAGFAAREREREAKPVKTRKSGDQPLFRHSESGIKPLIHAIMLYSSSFGARLLRPTMLSTGSENNTV